MTHLEWRKRNGPRRECTAHDAKIGGGCYNCGWEPHHTAPTHAAQVFRATRNSLPIADEVRASLSIATEAR